MRYAAPQNTATLTNISLPLSLITNIDKLFHVMLVVQLPMPSSNTEGSALPLWLIFVSMQLDVFVTENSLLHTRPSLRRLLSFSSHFYAAVSSRVPSLDVTILHRYCQDAKLLHRLQRPVDTLLIASDQSTDSVEIVKQHYLLPADLRVGVNSHV